MQRLLALIELSKRIESKGRFVSLDLEKVAAEFKKSPRTVLRWKAAWESGGVKILLPKVSSGRRIRRISGYTAKKILWYRRQYKWGAEVIAAHLKHDHGIVLTEGRINRYLHRKGLIDVKRRRTPRPKHTKVVRVLQPGQHTQSDVKHLPRFIRGRQNAYVYNFVDHASRWEFKRAYDSFGPSETKDFVHRVIDTAPFEITRWQTDNGIEVTFKFVSHVDNPREHVFDRLCEELGIRHVLIPPGEKELQGLVERSHRMDDNELYHRIRPKDVADFNRYLEAHCEWKNSKRRRKALEWKTPTQFLEEFERNTQQISEGNLLGPNQQTTTDMEPSDNDASIAA